MRVFDKPCVGFRRYYYNCMLPVAPPRLEKAGPSSTILSEALNSVSYLLRSVASPPVEADPWVNRSMRQRGYWRTRW